MENDLADDLPRKRRPARDDDEDDKPVRGKSKRPVARDEDDDDEPRRKEGKSGGPPVWLIVAGGALLLLFCVGGVGGLVYWLSTATVDRNTKGMGNMGPVTAVNTVANKPAIVNNQSEPAVKLPPGWEKFNDPLAEIDLYFPVGQPEKSASASGKVDSWTKTVGDKTYTLSRSIFTDAEVKRSKPENLLFDAQNAFWRAADGATGVKFGDTPVFKNGQVSRTLAFNMPNANKRIVSRGVVAGNRIVLIAVTGGLEIKATDADVQPYLDNLKVGK